MSGKASLKYKSGPTILTLLVVTAILLSIILYQSVRASLRDKETDFSCFLSASRSLMNGTDPYQTESEVNYKYPLFLALLLIPLLSVPPILASVFWFFINTLSLIISIIILMKYMSVAQDIQPRKILLLVFSPFLLILANIVQIDLRNGQCNLIIIMLMILFWHFNRIGMPVKASIAMGLGISIKLLPVIFIILLLNERRFRTILFSLMTAMTLCLLPFLLIGSKMLDFYKWYIDNYLFVKFIFRSGYISGQTFFTPGGFVAYILGHQQGSVILKLILSIIIVSILIAASVHEKKTRGSSDRNPSYWLFGIYLIAILLLFPESEKSHLSYLILPIIISFVHLVFLKGYRDNRQLILGYLFILFFAFGQFDPKGPYFFLAIFSLFILSAMNIFIPVRILSKVGNPDERSDAPAAIISDDHLKLDA